MFTANPDLLLLVEVVVAVVLVVVEGVVGSRFGAYKGSFLLEWVLI